MLEKEDIAKMDVLNILREEAVKRSPLIKVDIVQLPTYVEVFYDPDEKPSEIILIYKEASGDRSDDTKSTEGSKTPGSDQYDFDLSGNPLEAPFENIECNISIPAEKQDGHMWRKSEESHLPVSLEDARSIINDFSLQRKGNRNVQQPLDVWAVTKPSCSEDGKLKRHDVLLGLRISKVVKQGKLSHFARSVVTINSPCSTGSPEMKPLAMMKEHQKLCGSNTNVQSKVRCIYNLSGELTSEADRTSCSSSTRCYLEVKWKQPKLEPPLHEATSMMVIQVVLGQMESTVHSLWKQLWTLGKLHEMLEGPRRKLRSVERLPKYGFNIELNLTDNEGSNLNHNSVPEQLKKLFSGDYSSHRNGQNDGGFAGLSRGSDISDRMTMHRRVDNSKELKFKRSIEQVVLNKRINADATDDLWTIISDCESFNDLCHAFDTIYREVKRGQWKPFIRHKNQSHTSALLRALSSTTNNDSVADPIGFEDSGGVHFAVESLFELGLEKMANDYSYIIMESDLASYDELHPPSFPRKGLGVSRDSWLLKCKEYLSWLTKMHATLETLLLAENALTGIGEGSSSITSQALAYFQGADSPIGSAGLLNSDNLSVTFKAPVQSQQISKLLSRPFDLWQLTMTSDSPRLFVETVFHRSSFQVFPPRILTGDLEDYVPLNDKFTYCNCKLTTLMNPL